MFHAGAAPEVMTAKLTAYGADDRLPIRIQTTHPYAESLTYGAATCGPAPDKLSNTWHETARNGGGFGAPRSPRPQRRPICGCFAYKGLVSIRATVSRL